MRVDLNADIGEFASVDHGGNDERLLRTITSCNIACGFHAGDPAVMRHTVRMAARAGVAIGAHPSFRDTVGFGRREANLEPSEITALVVQQIEALATIATSEGAALRHVKPHGALYNMSARRDDIGEAVARAVASFDAALVVVGLPQSALLAAASRFGLAVAAEAFVDRLYEPDGKLTPRHIRGAVLSEPDGAAERAVRMVRDGRVVARDGSSLSIKVDTICVHSDTPGAAELAVAVREGLERAGVELKAL
ncbi:MAG TPA: 5-oxoprolinase subunit PxpA [Vicinamibacterales bacterium]|nr:5-oxoprolinase subunit PxpA [Vicinamibacterales bacterium]